MNMIEKVARAIEEASHGPNSLADVPYDVYLESISKAAIEAMREPTDRMTEVGCELLDAGHSLSTVYEEMINSALEEKRDD